MELLAYVDKSHGNLSGPATRQILEREYSEYGQAAYVRLAYISVAQIYRFRNSRLTAKEHQLPADPAHADPDRRAAQTATGWSRRFELLASKFCCWVATYASMLISTRWHDGAPYGRLRGGARRARP